MAKKKKTSTKRKPRRHTTSRSLKSTSKNTKRASKRLASKRTRGSRSESLTAKLARAFPRERRKDLLGLFMAVLGLLTILSMLSPQQNAITRAWIVFLGRGFGWGRYAIPLILLAWGIWVLLRNMVDQLPQLPSDRIIGGVMLYLALLMLMNAFIGVSDFEAGMAEADMGRGGGAVGAALLVGLLSSLGNAGTVVVLVAWILVGTVLLMGISLPDMFATVVEGMRWLIERIIRPQRAEPLRDSSPAAAEPHDVAAGAAKNTRAEARSAPGMDVEKRKMAQAVIEPPSAVPSLFSTPPDRVWELPKIEDILKLGTEGKFDQNQNKARAKLIEETLAAFGAPARVVEINRGPTITQFGVKPAYYEGRGGRRVKVKVSKISALADDLSLALAAPSIRIQAPVPGKNFVGIEVPNTEISLVALRAVMESKEYQKIQSPLRIGLGQDVSGNAVVTDLAVMPHLLIAGTTGSGKSVCINTIITNLLLQNTPEELRFVMIDPKRVELTLYNGIPHLLAPVIVNLERVVPTLQWVSREMDQRYHGFAKQGVRNLDEYNKRMAQINQPGKPYLIVLVDELADLMMMAADETERVITRLAQLARATGIHLVIATQRPSTDVVTGLIKANFPARIAFAVASSIDSRVILDQPGAERLLGRGDMLFNPPDASAPIRMQGAFVSEEEVYRLIRHWKNAALSGETTQPSKAVPAEIIPPGAELTQVPLWEEVTRQKDSQDSVYNEAVELVRRMRRASISLLQRRLRIGYTRAARLIDQMEENGIIGPAQRGSKPREVINYGELAGATAPPSEGSAE